MVKTVLKVDGMSCGMCESHMNDLVRSLFPVKKVSSSAKDSCRRDHPQSRIIKINKI